MDRTSKEGESPENLAPNSFRHLYLSSFRCERERSPPPPPPCFHPALISRGRRGEEGGAEIGQKSESPKKGGKGEEKIKPSVKRKERRGLTFAPDSPPSLFLLGLGKKEKIPDDRPIEKRGEKETVFPFHCPLDGVSIPPSLAHLPLPQLSLHPDPPVRFTLPSHGSIRVAFLGSKTSLPPHEVKSNHSE